MSPANSLSTLASIAELPGRFELRRRRPEPGPPVQVGERAGSGARSHWENYSTIGGQLTTSLWSCGKPDGPLSRVWTVIEAALVALLHDREVRLAPAFAQVSSMNTGDAPHPDRSEAAAAARKPAPQCTQTGTVVGTSALRPTSSGSGAGDGHHAGGRPATRDGAGHRTPESRAPRRSDQPPQGPRSLPPGNC